MASNKSSENQVLEKLDIIVLLLGHIAATEQETLKSKALLLKSIGLKNPEIAKICGTTSKTISVRLAEARRKWTTK